MPHNWILHVDGDAFFASCEQAINPRLKGKPIVTGGEKHIITSASYEAQQYGITRGTALWEAKKMCKQLQIASSGFGLYTEISDRMFRIMRRFSPTVETYSVDEGFADITGLDRVFHCSYQAIAHCLQQAIHQELGISVSVGVSTTKTLAKVASKQHKPAGLTIIPPAQRLEVLAQVPIEKVWNIGYRTAPKLKSYGIHTARDFASRSTTFIRSHFSRPILDVWHELNGIAVFSLHTEEKEAYKSIQKQRTFWPASSNPEMVFAHLVRNLEGACAKARAYNQAPRYLGAWLRQQNFKHTSKDLKLWRPSAYPHELLPVLRQLFDSLFEAGTEYRMTGVWLSDLRALSPLQIELFESPQAVARTKQLYQAVDAIHDKYQQTALYQAASLPARRPSPAKAASIPLPLLHIEAQ